MLQRLTLRGVLALLLVLTGASALPTLSTRQAHSVSIAQRSERRLAAELHADRPARTSSSPLTRPRRTSLTPHGLAAEHALFQRPPPAPLA